MSAAVDAPSAPRRIALVGLGKMGRHHLRVLRATAGIDVVAVVDSTAPRPDDLGSASFHRSTSELRHQDFDAAVVATPTETHGDVASELIAMGKDLLVEKPLAASFHQGRRVLSSAQRHGTEVVVGHVERFNPAVRKLREVIAQGLIGAPMHFAFTRVGAYPEGPLVGTNVVLDLAVHDIDVLRSLTGPLRLEHSRCRASGGDGVLDAAEIFLASESGCTATVHVNWITPTKIRSIRVTGTHGVCLVDYAQQTCELLGRRLGPGGEPVTLAADAMRDVDGAAERVALSVPKAEPLRAQADQFRTLLATGDPGDLCTGSDALAAVLLAERAVHAGQRRARPGSPRAPALGPKSPGPFVEELDAGPGDDWV